MINFRVSVARADVIAKTLIRMGADRAQLQIDAISDSSPEFLEVMPTGEAGNRRAEIYLES
jgi:outer membrane protein OmpA-like peptidoglycan-associated protein